MIQECKYYSDVMQKLMLCNVMTIEDNEDFENSTKRWICDNAYIEHDVKVRDNCLTTKKYRC